MQKIPYKIDDTLDQTVVKQLIFKVIKITINIFYRKNCRIDSIQKDAISGEFIVTFIYIFKRQLFIKPLHEIVENKSLLNDFPASEAALLGFYQCMAQFEKNARQINAHIYKLKVKNE